MTNTYAFVQMRPITPLVDGLQSCICIEQEAEETDQAVDALEMECQRKTVNAVKELEKKLNQEKSGNDIECEPIVEAENVDHWISKVDCIEENEVQVKDTEMKMTERSGSRVEKRRREVEEEAEVVEQEIRRRRVDGNTEDEDELIELGTDEDLKYS